MALSKPKIPTWPYRRAGNAPKTINALDYEGVRKGIDDVSKRLFKQDGTVELLACRWSEQETLRPSPIFSYDELDTYLERHFPSNQPAPNPVANVFLIDQEHTKAGLDITQDGLNMLLDHIDAFPQLGYALPAFAASDVPVHEGKTNFNSLQRWETSGDFTFELSMLLKYVELNGNKSDPVPYSIRQQLFYQNFCWEKKMESAVLFRASTVLKRRIQEEFHGQGGYASHWTNLPVLLIGSIPSGWAEYVKFLDEGVWRIEKSSSFTNPFLESLGEANFKTLQATQKYHDLLSRATHVLQNNIRTLNSLFKESKKRKKAEKGGFEEHYELLDTTIEDVNDELEGFVKHAGLILARLTRITEAIRDSIALRSSHHASTESDNMRHLTQQSIREARTVKVIALVTLIYLPATFVATFLGMNSLRVSSSGKNGLLHVSADPELWIYLALTVPLTFGTLLAWWGWEWWTQKENRDSAILREKVAAFGVGAV